MKYAVVFAAIPIGLALGAASVAIILAVDDSSEGPPSELNASADALIAEAHTVDALLAEAAGDPIPCQGSCQSHEPDEALWIIKLRCEKSGGIAFPTKNPLPREYSNLQIALRGSCDAAASPDSADSLVTVAASARAGLRQAIDNAIEFRGRD